MTANDPIPIGDADPFVLLAIRSHAYYTPPTTPLFRELVAGAQRNAWHYQRNQLVHHHPVNETCNALCVVVLGEHPEAGKVRG